MLHLHSKSLDKALNPHFSLWLKSFHSQPYKVHNTLKNIFIPLEYCPELKFIDNINHLNMKYNLI